MVLRNEPERAALGPLDDLRLQRLETPSAEIRRSPRWQALMFLLFTGIVLLWTAWSRRVYQAHLWRRLEQLRQLVSEVRHGNLDVTTEIPQSVEFGPLMSTFLAMAVDIRDVRASLERKVLERTAKLELAQSELLQSAKLASLGELISGLAHEINNPITSILGFIEVPLGRQGGGARPMARNVSISVSC